LARSTVLAVEDEPDILDLVSAVLEAEGYRVLTAAGSDEALSILADDHPVDLLLTDIIMRNSLSGFALAEQAKALRPGLRVIYTTGYAEEALKAEQQERLGRLLLKPWRANQLVELVADVLA
jgi:DNA-binding NtrC family response regulator